MHLHQIYTQRHHMSAQTPLITVFAFELSIIKSTTHSILSRTVKTKTFNIYLCLRVCFHLSISSKLSVSLQWRIQKNKPRGVYLLIFRPQPLLPNLNRYKFIGGAPWSEQWQRRLEPIPPQCWICSCELAPFGLINLHPSPSLPHHLGLVLTQLNQHLATRLVHQLSQLPKPNIGLSTWIRLLTSNRTTGINQLC